MTLSTNTKLDWARITAVRDLHSDQGIMLRYVTSLGIATTVLAGTPSVRAAADTQAPPRQDQQQTAPGAPPEPLPRRTSIHAIAGFGTPLGAIGIESVHRFGSIFEFAVGIGAGQTALEAASSGVAIGNPVQWAMMPRLRIGSERHAFTTGAGISGGNFAVIHRCLVGQDGCTNATSAQAQKVGYVLWSNLEIGGEVWTPNGLSFRYFAGYGHVLTPGGLHCVNSAPPCTNPPSAGQDLPYVGVGLGYAF